MIERVTVGVRHFLAVDFSELELLVVVVVDVVIVVILCLVTNQTSSFSGGNSSFVQHQYGNKERNLIHENDDNGCKGVDTEPSDDGYSGKTSQTECDGCRDGGHGDAGADLSHGFFDANGSLVGWIGS